MIRHAFLELRKKQKIDYIKVMKLCEVANVNKSTFYRYYSDVYALEEELENELIDTFVKDINSIQTIYGNPELFFNAFDKALNGEKNIELKEILFRENYSKMLSKLEEALKNAYLEDEHFDFEEYLRISFILGGSFGVCMTLYNQGGVANTAPIYKVLSDLLKKTLD